MRSFKTLVAQSLAGPRVPVPFSAFSSVYFAPGVCFVLGLDLILAIDWQQQFQFSHPETAVSGGIKEAISPSSTLE